MLRRLLPILVLLVAMPAAAQERETPYWASIRAEVLNMRVGPSENYPIDWVYKRKGLPLKVVRIMQGWRWAARRATPPTPPPPPSSAGNPNPAGWAS